MHNKKYRLEQLEEFNGHNPLYDNVRLGCICYLAYLMIGERGWFMYETGDPYDPPHRIHTSTIYDVKYRGELVVVTTHNTRFTFREV